MSNCEVIANMYKHFETGEHEAIAAGEAEPMLDVFHDDTVWFEACGNARSGTFRGVAEIVEHTATCLSLTDGTWGTDVVEIFGGDQHVVVIERALALRNGKTLNMLCNTVYQMTDGSINEVRVLPYDPAGWNAFWS